MIALRTDIFKTSSIILYYDFDVINLLLYNSAEINRKIYGKLPWGGGKEHTAYDINYIWNLFRDYFPGLLVVQNVIWKNRSWKTPQTSTCTLVNISRALVKNTQNSIFICKKTLMGSGIKLVLENTKNQKTSL